ncbi:MAG: transketolase [Alphaproteobacteria bacterium]|nr:transketolase [Alphaproteobacteria bacterium]
MTEAAVTHNQMANAIRALSMDAVQAANSGHPGMPMGMADIATVLFKDFLKFDSSDAAWPDRDRFVLSNGHGSMLLYSLLYLTGYPDMNIEQIRNFRQLGSKTAGHPEFGHAQGIETTTGPLGQGIATAVGMALAERMLAARHGPEIVDHHTYVFAGDGCLMEGISHEAASLAGHLGLGKLIVLFDDNAISIDGPTDLSVRDDQIARFKSYGWEASRIDGHDPEAIAKAIAAARQSDRPSLIACRTVIGYGSPNKQGTEGTHGAPLGADEVKATRDELGWPHEPFVVPDDILTAWNAVGQRGESERSAWTARLDTLAPEAKAAFESTQSGALPENWERDFEVFKQALIAEQPKLATRQASQKSLDALAAIIPNLAGGSADLTGSNLTKARGMEPVRAEDFSGSYIYYGVREHGMAAAMNGIALHGGLIPYGGTFLIFTDYCRPSIRLSALMGQRVIYVMTHDSIGLGEDGPTHQPVEQIASLRAMPNLNVFRPADAVETAECWALALKAEATPSVLALTRQGLPTLRTSTDDGNLCARGAYVLADAEGERQVTLLATGSEVSVAFEARDLLQADGIGTAVVSMPCHELFEAQEPDYKEAVLGRNTVRIAVEAAVSQGWDRYIGPDGLFVGMTGFGASAPADALYKHFGITAEAVAEAARQHV